MKTKDLYAQEVQRLEKKRQYEMDMLKIELKTGYDYIQPVNILKRTLSKAARSPEIQGDILKILINSVTGLLTKKMVEGESKSPAKKWLASLIQSYVGKYVGNHENDLKLKLMKGLLSLLNNIHFKKSPSPEYPETDSTGHVSKSAA